VSRVRFGGMWFRVGALVFAVVLGAVLGRAVALAETADAVPYYADPYGNIHDLEGYTSTFYQDPSGIYYSTSWSYAFVCPPYQNCVNDTAYFLWAESRGYNGGYTGNTDWHIVDDQYDYCYYCALTNPLSTYAWQTLPGEYPSYYVTTNSYEDLYNGGPYFEVFSSDDGAHSTAACFETAGC
jgi:hypothetical protein